MLFFTGAGGGRVGAGTGSGSRHASCPAAHSSRAVTLSLSRLRAARLAAVELVVVALGLELQQLARVSAQRAAA